jgi:hypothetical protein
MRDMKLATLLLFLAVTAISGDDSVPRTGGFINGRTWRDMPPQQKTGYLVGFADGIKVPTYDNNKEDQALAAAARKRFFGDSRLGEITAAVDDFYRDPANLQIQVYVAFKYFQDKVNGASPESLAKDLANYRKFSADHVDK